MNLALAEARKLKGPYYMNAEIRVARQFATRVKEFETRGEIGCWGEWQRWVDQWPVDSMERAVLSAAFGGQLAELDDEESGKQDHHQPW